MTSQNQLTPSLAMANKALARHWAWTLASCSTSNGKPEQAMSKHQIRNAKQGKAGTGLQAANGYVLLLVIVSGIILAIGAMIISARSFNSVIRSSKQSDGDQAIEIAETGASILVNKLNNNFPYLLTTNCQVENNGLSQQLERPTCKGWKKKRSEGGGALFSVPESSSIEF